MIGGAVERDRRPGTVSLVVLDTPIKTEQAVTVLRQAILSGRVERVVARW